MLPRADSSNHQLLVSIFFCLFVSYFPGGCVTGIYHFHGWPNLTPIQRPVGPKSPEKLVKPTGIKFLSANQQAQLIFPVKLWLAAIPGGWPKGKYIPVGFPHFPVGFRLTEKFQFLVVAS